ncbi:MAG: hypothetical protein LBD23_13165, partial [Oscillospiraceae bacterium]|nr:hypothetical protein [Oscillospiraceae bacterium]
AQGFIAKGIITLPEDVKNPDNILLEVEIIVIVKEKTTDTCFSHEYDGSGYCIYCNYEYNINWTTYNIPRIYKTVVSYEESRIRVRPYSTASYRQVEYGTEFTIVAFGRSSNETLWYLTSTDEYIFSQRVEYVREA